MNNNPAPMSAGNRGEWVPEGFVLVPREPTPEMIAEGSQSIACDTNPMRKPQRTTRERAARNAFVTMLSASPAPPPSSGSPTLHGTNDGCDGVDAVRDALNVCLGHLTGGLDGDYRDCDPVELARAALAASTSGECRRD